MRGGNAARNLSLARKPGKYGLGYKYAFRSRNVPPCDIEDLTSKLPAGSRLCGIDLGDKTVGLALSDAGLMVAGPLETLKRKKFTQTANELRALFEAHKVGGIVIGLPLNMDGTEGRRCQSTRQFIVNLIEFGIDLPVVYWDERLSTVPVE
ncbi:MAG: Holliday junction resolvase RuvX, partial [Rhodospirillaceae bacterium]|nr:Holliday junction resolvase RuvX [Rhodospirillaceae bacterium]